MGAAARAWYEVGRRRNATFSAAMYAGLQQWATSPWDSSHAKTDKHNRMVEKPLSDMCMSIKCHLHEVVDDVLEVQRALEAKAGATEKVHCGTAVPQAVSCAGANYNIQSVSSQ